MHGGGGGATENEGIGMKNVGVEILTESVGVENERVKIREDQ